MNSGGAPLRFFNNLNEEFMKYILPLFSMVLFLLCGCKFNNAQTNSIQLDLDLESVISRGGSGSELFLLVANESIAIGQHGDVDLIAIDYTTGKKISKMDMHMVSGLVEERVKSALGTEFYVPGIEEFLEYGIYAGKLPYDFHKFLYHSESEKFAVFIRYVIFNTENLADQQLFDVMLFFNETFEDMEAIPLDYINRGPSPGLYWGGFFEKPDRLFTKLFSFNHQESFDFVEYKLVDDGYFKLVDTLKGIRTSKVTHRSCFFTTFSFNEYKYLNLGMGLHRYEASDINSGEFISFPFDSTYSCLYIEPLNADYLVAYFVNDYDNEPDAIGQLVLLDRNLKSADIVEEFDLTELRFSSFFVYDGVVSLINYKWDDEEFYLTRYANLR